MSSSVIHVSVMNIISRSCYVASSRIRRILLLIEQVFSDIYLIRQVFRVDDDRVVELEVKKDMAVYIGSGLRGICLLLW